MFFLAYDFTTKADETIENFQSKFSTKDALLVISKSKNKVGLLKQNDK